jgi:hypothetical protein
LSAAIPSVGLNAECLHPAGIRPHHNPARDLGRLVHGLHVHAAAYRQRGPYVFYSSDGGGHPFIFGAKALHKYNEQATTPRILEQITQTKTKN